MQLPIKVKACAMVHPSSMRYSFRHVELAAQVSFAIRSTLKINGWVCIAFRACRARAALHVKPNK